MNIINAHCHIYPQKISAKATQAIGDFYNTSMFGKGTVEDLIQEGKSVGIARFLVCSCATTMKQVRSINEFLLNERDTHENVSALITLHQDMTEEQAFEEVDWAIAHDFKGIKLHPDFQRFSVNDPAAFGIYEAARGRLPILFHAGDYRYKYSNPSLLAEVAKLFPDLNMVCAHFGGYSEWENVSVYDGLKNVYYDTSSSLFALDPQEATRIIHRFGVDKFCFGTDYPMWSAEEEIERFERLGLTQNEKEQIYHINAERVYNIK